MKKNKIKRDTFLGFPGGSEVKNPPADAGDACWIPDLGGSHMPRSQ